MRPTTVTLVDVDGAHALPDVARAAGAAANVSAVLRDPELPGSERAAKAWAEIERCHSAYVVTDVDPLHALVDAYVEGWASQRLELLDIARLAPPRVAPPDFYLLLDTGEADRDLKSPRFLSREWFLGVVARLAPSRVLPVVAADAPEATARRVLEQLAGLPMGVPIPGAEALLEQARKRVPGQSR